MTRASDTARILSGGAVINEDSNDVDLRVEGNGDANLLVCDAGSDFVAIGETSQVNGGKLNIATSAEGAALSFLCRSTTDSHQPEIVMQKSSTDSGNFAATADGESLGSIKFRGVNTSAVSDIGAQIAAVQSGTSSSTVPTDLVFNTNETERFRITQDGSNNGRAYINADDPAANSFFSVTGNNSSHVMLVTNDTGGSGGACLRIKVNGTVVGQITNSSSSTSYGTSSDYRLKENVNYDFDATTRLKQLKPCTFNWIVDKDNTTVDGFLAHEVSSIVPEAVNGEKDAVDSDGNIEPQNIDQSKLVPLLVKTIQELEARIAILESK